MKFSIRQRQFVTRAVFLLSALLMVAAFWPLSGESSATALADPAAAATTTPIFPNAVLRLTRFTFDCVSTRYQAFFTVTNINPAIVKTFGTVDYSIGSLPHAAVFTGLQGTRATYVDQGTLPRRVTKDDKVNIRNATVTLGTDRGDVVLTANSRTIALDCAAAGTATPTATATATPTETGTAVPTATQTPTTAATLVATAVPTATSAPVTTAVPGTTGSNTGGAGQPGPATLPVTGVDSWGRTLILFLLSLLVLGIGLALSRWSRMTR